MAKEYQTFNYLDNNQGHQDMAADIDRLAREGWEIKSKEVVGQGWSFGKTCCLGCIFLPLALLGKKTNEIQVIFEREVITEKSARKNENDPITPPTQVVE